MPSKKELVVVNNDIDKVKEKQRNILGIPYKVFEIPKKEPIGFELKAISNTINVKETEMYVYWVVQSISNFKKAVFLEWKNNSETIPLYKYLNSLNKAGTATKYIDKGVGVNYLKSFKEVENKFVYEPIVIGYDNDKEGEGIWLEACNYYPEYKNQGAFIIAVAPPYIKKAVVNKMEGQEALCTYNKSTKELQGKIQYGDYIEFTVKTHNILPDDFTGTITIRSEGKILEVIKLNESNVIPQYENVPGYNATYLKRKVYLDLSWIGILGHQEGTSKTYYFDIEFKVKNTKTYGYKIDPDKVKMILEREVFYEDAWSINEEEPSIVPKIAQISEPEVVTLMIEECRYTKLSVSHKVAKINDAGEKVKETRVYEILEEGDDCLVKNENLPSFAVIAGSETNPLIVEIAVDRLDRKNCENGHKGEKLSVFNKGIETKKAFTDGNPRVDVEVISDLSKFNVLPLQYIWPSSTTPNVYQSHIVTCRYARPLLVNVYPDIKWELKFFLNLTNNLSLRGKNVNAQKYKDFQTNSGKIKAEKRWKQKEASIGFSLKSFWDYDGNKYNKNLELKAEYEGKFKKLYELFSSISSTADAITEGTGGNIRNIGMLKGLPITVAVKPPNVSFDASWLLEPVGNSQGTKVSVGFNAKPLIGLEITIDLLCTALETGAGIITGGVSLGRVARLANIIRSKLKKGIDIGSDTFGVKSSMDIYIDLVITGTIQSNLGFSFNTGGGDQEEAKIEVSSTLKVEVKAGALAKGEVALVFIVAEAYFSGEIKGESGVTFGHTLNYVKNEGLFYRPKLGFDGLIVKTVLTVYSGFSTTKKLEKRLKKGKLKQAGGKELYNNETILIPKFDVVKKLEELSGIDAKVYLVKK